MSASNYLAGATIAAAAFRGAQQGNAKFRPLMAWIEDIKPRDRHNIINGLPLEPTPAPPRPANQAPISKNLKWLIPGLVIWLVHSSAL